MQLNFVSSHQVLAELKRSNFTLLNQSIQFDMNGDPKFGSYTIVFWNQSSDTEEIGYFKFNPSANYFINNNRIQWYTNGEVSVISLTTQNAINKCLCYYLVSNIMVTYKILGSCRYSSYTPFTEMYFRKSDLLLNNYFVQVPASLCSPECPVGHAKKQDGIHKCCFTCEICPKGTYLNTTGK